MIRHFDLMRVLLWVAGPEGDAVSYAPFCSTEKANCFGDKLHRTRSAHRKVELLAHDIFAFRYRTQGQHR
jgi:hypothetical protein